MSLLKPVRRKTRPRGIRVRYYHVDTSVDLHDMIAVVSFHGKMPDGSRGKGHGRYIGAQAVYWMSFIDAISVVLDFRDLDYKWGDGMIAALQAIDLRFREQWTDIDMATPIKLVTSSKSIGLQSLVSDPDALFSNVDEAVLSCSKAVRLWLDSD